MGEALAALADDDDFLSLDEIYIGIAIVIDTHFSVPLVSVLVAGLDRVFSAQQGDDAGARNFGQSQRFHESDEGIKLRRFAGHFEYE